jgi:putative FmdB family regulatory protein
MPLYEYVCQDCESKFEELRPLCRMDDPANCPLGHLSGRRVLSMFATMTKDAGGETVPVGGGGCGGGCTNCACSLN